jgi:UDP-N-acetylmuramoyl-L-alanyl-D-glutamate--2,6-diaminopimelate ligase
MTLSQPVPPPVRPERGPSRSLAEVAKRFGCVLGGSAQEVPADSSSKTPEGTSNLADVQLTGLTVSSSDVHPGDLFVALPGLNQHGATFAADARDRGAAAILTDSDGSATAGASGLPVIVLDSLRSRLGDVAAWFYGTADSGVELFAVTGTNGKTSTVYILEAILNQLDVPVGLSSTAQRRFGKVELVSGLTTPEATELHSLIARMSEAGVRAAAIEVSAQALSRHRVDGAVFDVAGFTNLTHDHLDDYGDMETYLAAKAPLFQPEHARRAVICLDTPAGAELVASAGIPVVTIATAPESAAVSDSGAGTAETAPEADWLVEVTGEDSKGVYFTVSNRDGWALSTSVSVIGRHMAANAGLAIAMLAEGGFELERIAETLTRDGGIRVHPPGRTERVSGNRGPTVYVDFGHSADAFAKTLDAIRKVTAGKVIMVFGADGDRDKTKRPAMARAAIEGSDLLIVTDHHPRFEDPQIIRTTLVESAREARPDVETIEVPNPKQAIREAVRRAKEGDSILWAGPGHQNYRDIRGVHVPYSARAEARAALVESGWA